MLTSLIKINCEVQDLSGATSISKLLIEAERGKMREMLEKRGSEQMFDCGARKQLKDPPRERDAKNKIKFNNK